MSLVGRGATGAPVTLAALGAWAALLVGARLWGLRVVDDAGSDELKLGAMPLYGRWEWLVGPQLVVTMVGGVAAGVLAVGVLPWVARRWSWRQVLVVVALAAAGWSLALAFVDADPSMWPDPWTDINLAYGRHAGLVDEAGGAAQFLRTYVEQQPGHPIHLQAHPPGLVLALWVLAGAGLAGPVVEVTIALAGVTAAAVAALVVVRDVAGEPLARAAAPFVVLVPATVWHTNADVIFGGVALAGVAAAVVATGRSGRRAVLPAIAGGVLLGTAMLLSYGMALMTLPVLVVAVWRRRWTALVVAGMSAAATVALPLLWGFWWLDGLAATQAQYAAGVAGVRPYAYFVLANLAVFALALGPAIAVALARLRNRRLWVVVGAGLVVVAIADLSGLSSGEVERIWQPFVPLVAVAGAALATRERPAARGWLALQVVVTVVLQMALRSPW